MTPSAPRRSKTRALSALLPTVTAKACGRRGLGDGVLLARWAEIMGPEIAACCAPEKMSYPRGARLDGSLHLRVAPERAVEVQHMAPRILERINGFLGYRAVARLKLVQAPLDLAAPPTAPKARPLTPDESAALADRLTAVGDSDLRVALDGLGRAVIGDDPA